MLTQSTLAKRIGHSRSYLARVEAGIQDPSLKFVNAVSEGLRIPAGLILLNRDELQEDSPFICLCDMFDAILDSFDKT